MNDTASTESTGSTTTGPTSFSDPSLTWSGDSSTPTPTSDSPTPDSASAATTEPPVVEATPDGTTPGVGEPPKERWDSILANARQKAAEEATAQYAWAKQVNPQEFQQIQQLARTLSANPIEGLQQLIGEIRKDPQYDAALKSMAARALAQGQRQQSQATEPQMVQVQLEDGSVVAMPRDPGAWLEHQKQQWLAQVKQEFSPVTQTIETLQAERAAAQHAQQIEHFVSSTYQDMTSWPGMERPENQKAVAQAISQMGLPDSASTDQVRWAAERAWRLHVAPHQSRQAEAKLLDSLKTKAAASTGVNPGSAAPSASRAVTKFTDLGPDAWR